MDVVVEECVKLNQQAIEKSHRLDVGLRQTFEGGYRSCLQLGSCNIPVGWVTTRRVRTANPLQLGQ